MLHWQREVLHYREMEEIEVETEMPEGEIEADIRGKEESKAAQDYDLSHEDQLYYCLFVCQSVVPFYLVQINHFISDFQSNNNVTCFSGAYSSEETNPIKAARVDKNEHSTTRKEPTKLKLLK